MNFEMRVRLMLLFILAVASGCGGQKEPVGTVKGKVVVAGGSPTEQLRVVFYNSMTGKGGTGMTDDTGSFSFRTPVSVGDYTVFFEKLVKGDGESTSEESLTLVSIDRAYTTEESSPLKLTVNSGPNEYDIDVPPAKASKKSAKR